MKYFLGIDVGSISTNLALLDEDLNVIDKLYIRTDGKPIKAIQEGLTKIKRAEISAVGTTGSARKLAGIVAGADIIKTEIIAHAVAAQSFVPDVRTILEIGGQDSKIILLRNGIVVDFAMNTICAAGCGAFLDHQSNRLGIPIQDFGGLTLTSCNAATISGRCTVFAESDMIHKQQVGYRSEDIIKGLCEAIVRNYLNNVGKGKEINPQVVFQGGVAANVGVKNAFEKMLNCEVIVPEHFSVMGAIGAAILALEEKPEKTAFKGFDIKDIDFQTTSFICEDCPNLCEIIVIEEDKKVTARWGSRCGKWNV